VISGQRRGIRIEDALGFGSCQQFENGRDRTDEFVGFLTAAGCSVLLSIFATFADVRDRTEGLMWIFCIAVGAIAFFLTRHQRDCWFKYKREEIENGEAPSTRQPRSL
jgi:hypothetical protein